MNQSCQFLCWQTHKKSTITKAPVTFLQLLEFINAVGFFYTLPNMLHEIQLHAWNTGTRLIHKVSFPGAVYRNKTQLHGNIYCNRYSKCSVFFNIFVTGIETFVIPWDQLLYTVVEVCRLGLEPLCSDVSCFATHRAHNFLNNKCSVPISCNKEQEICGKWLLGSVIVKLCSVHSETLSMTALHSRRELE
jgi:hypothetical protein